MAEMQDLVQRALAGSSVAEAVDPVPRKDIKGTQVVEEAAQPAQVGEAPPEGMQCEREDATQADTPGNHGQGRGNAGPVAASDAPRVTLGPVAPHKRAAISDNAAVPRCNRTQHEVAKPLWALSETEATNLMEEEEAALLDFAECLDFDALMHDMADKELSAALMVCPCAPGLPFQVPTCTFVHIVHLREVCAGHRLQWLIHHLSHALAVVAQQTAYFVALRENQGHLVRRMYAQVMPCLMDAPCQRSHRSVGQPC